MFLRIPVTINLSPRGKGCENVQNFHIKKPALVFCPRTLTKLPIQWIFDRDLCDSELE